MGIAIEQKVVLSAPPDRVWAFLTDPVQVAACIPGAAITSRIDDRTFEGTMTVKVGPVTATYKGRASFERLDPEHLEAEIVGRGQDVKGKGGAELRMKSRLVPRDDGATEVIVASDVNISGILAQMGRGMIESVSTQIFQQFTGAMKRRLETSAGSGEDGAAPPAPEPTSLDVLSLGAKAVGQSVGQAVKRLLGGGGTQE
jgi:uncharacterized protein